MSSEQYETSYLFQTQHIYHKLYSDWESDLHNQIDIWLQSWEYHTIPDDTLSTWKSLYEVQMQKIKEIEDRHKIVCTAR